MHDAEIVEVYRAADAAQAHFLMNLLGDSGIEARVVGETLTALGYPPGTPSAVQLWVHQGDQNRAREILAEWEAMHLRPRPDNDPRRAWKCAVCGELVDEDFELCWNCQNPRTPY